LPRPRRDYLGGACPRWVRAEVLDAVVPGWIRVSPEIAKGGRERWVPVIEELEAVVGEIRRNVAADEYVLPAQRAADPGINLRRFDIKNLHSSSQALRNLVRGVGFRAGIAAPIFPHLLRHAYGDHIARHAGIRMTQFLLVTLGSRRPEAYVGPPTLDELRRAVTGASYRLSERTSVLGVLTTPNIPLEATTGIEPV
jgi:hypothetical protein